MDFLLKHKHRIRRMVSKGGMSIGLSPQPFRLIVDLRNQRTVESFVYDKLVENISANPSYLVVVLADQTTQNKSLCALLRFLYRLDCAVVLRSYSCLVEVPFQLLSHYVYVATDDKIQTIPQKFTDFERFRLELEYNRNTEASLVEILERWSSFQKISLVLPEFAKDLPSNDKTFFHCKSRFSFLGRTSSAFCFHLEKLRAEQNGDLPGYSSNKKCRINQMQIVIETEIRSCPHHDSGGEHAEAVRNCSRLCTSTLLRMPMVRDFGLFSHLIQRKSQ